MEEGNLISFYIEKAKKLHHEGDFKNSYRLYKKLAGKLLILILNRS